MISWYCYPCLLLLGSVLNSVYAVEVEEVTASKSGDQYTVNLVMTADIPESFAREILEDPDRVVKVNNELLAVYHIPSEQEGVRWFRDHTRACILFFCAEYENTLSMRILDNNDIQLTVEPELSEFKYGVFTWHTEPISANQVRLTFYSVSTPGFWVPSTGLMKSRMRRGIKEMLRRMECEYRQDAACAHPDSYESDVFDD